MAFLKISVLSHEQLLGMMRVNFPLIRVFASSPAGWWICIASFRHMEGTISTFAVLAVRSPSQPVIRMLQALHGAVRSRGPHAGTIPQCGCVCWHAITSKKALVETMSPSPC